MGTANSWATPLYGHGRYISDNEICQLGIAFII